MPIDPHAQFLINQQVTRYRSDLSSWVARVRAARSDADAFRIAANPPAPGHLIRSLNALTQSDKNRAQMQVEELLHPRALNSDAKARDFALLMRLAQGHWPRIWQLLERNRRANSGL